MGVTKQTSQAETQIMPAINKTKIKAELSSGKTISMSELKILGLSDSHALVKWPGGMTSAVGHGTGHSWVPATVQLVDLKKLFHCYSHSREVWDCGKPENGGNGRLTSKRIDLLCEKYAVQRLSGTVSDI